jgi:hypothetical protein
MAQTSLPSDCCGQPEKNGLFLEFKLFQIGSSITTTRSICRGDWEALYRGAQPPLLFRLTSHVIFRAKNAPFVAAGGSNPRPAASCICLLTIPPISHLCPYVIYISLVLSSYNF